MCAYRTETAHRNASIAFCMSSEERKNTMVWQRIIRRFSKNSSTGSRRSRKRRLRLESMERRELLASDLGAISGTAFVDQNGDGSSVGDPAVFVDASGDLVAPGTAGAQGIQVQLFRDTNGDDALDAGDLLIGTDFTDNNGEYRFDELEVDTYFLVQQSVPQLNTPASVTVEVTNAMGIQTSLIDDYSVTSQSVTAMAAETIVDSIAAPEAIGGERDVQVINTANTGQVTAFIDNGTLSIGALGDGTGSGLIQYDGVDGTLALNPTGLAGVSLVAGAPGDTLDPGAGLIVQTRAENAGDQLTVTVHTDGGNSSFAVINLPQDNTDFIETFVRFSDFATASGAGADFNDVGAIEASITLSPNNDTFISIVEARRPDVVVEDIPNIVPVALGGEVFIDNSSNGQNDGIRDPNEPGQTGVFVELHEVANPGDTVDPTNSIAVASQFTGANGAFLFAGLDPGNYAVVIPANQFDTGATLFGFASSTGAGIADDDIDGNDDGTTLVDGNVISSTVVLASNSEPINDDDTDPNTNTTVDFGVFPQIDLVITKTLNVAASNAVAGGNAVFDIVVSNEGPLTATNVSVEDTIPQGLTFTGIANSSGTFTPTINGNIATIEIGTILAGAQQTFQVTTDVDANQTADVTNTATVTGDEVDINPDNNTDDELVDLPEADLSIEKTALTNPVNAGDQLVYQITVTNNGPDGAEGIVVTDPLPADVTFISGDVGGASNLVSFDPNTGEVTATVGVLANGASSVITLTVDVATNASSPLNNVASVTSDPNTDPNPDNNTDAVDTTVEREVDVAVDKTVTGTPVAGQNVTYTILVTNNGPSEARDISVVDTLDSLLTFVNGSFDAGTTGATLSQSGQELTFDVGTLDQSETASFTFDVSIASSASGTIPNTATVSTSDIDTVPENDTDTVNIDVDQQVDLILTKTVDLTTAVPGQDQLVYTFTVSHDTDSVSDASNVQVTDALPAGLLGAVISAPDADDTEFANGIVTVEFDSLPVGETRTFTVTSTIDQSATGSIINPASVTSDGTDIDPANNDDTATTTLTPDFDVVVSKSVDNPNPSVNGTVVYTVGLNNEGPSAATGIILSDPIPAGLTFVSGTLNGVAGSSDGSIVTFPGIDLLSGGTATALLTFTVDATTSGVVTNTASIPDLSGDGENDITNNSASADITVTPQTDVGITKSVSLTEAQIGSELVYTIEVTNNGPSLATNVQVVDTLPAGVTFVSGIGPNGEGLSVNAGTVTVNGGDLANAGTFSFTINGTIDAGATGVLTNAATVSTDVNDTNAANNTAFAATTVDPATSSIAGTVFVDVNNNGVQDAGESGIANVALTLEGIDTLGNAINASATTDANGNYLFSNLPAGTYSVTETQPVGFLDGIESVGSGATASAADNIFTSLGLGVDAAAVDFDFGELTETLSKRRFLASS